MPFHEGRKIDGRHYWLTPPDMMEKLNAEFSFDFDPCPFPKPELFCGLEADWGQSNYVNPPFGSIIKAGKKFGPTAWARKAILESQKGKDVVLVFPLDKWIPLPNQSWRGAAKPWRCEMAFNRGWYTCQGWDRSIHDGFYFEGEEMSDDKGCPSCGCLLGEEEHGDGCAVTPLHREYRRTHGK